MALAFRQNEFGVKRTGQSVTVADNDIAKLMYYLNCVCTTIDCNNDPEIRRFTNYSNWHSLSTDEQRQLVVLCYTFSPDIFEDKIFFQKDALCIGCRNEFYEISQVSSQLVAVRSIIIAGRTRRVNNIMAYKMSWMQSNYLEPMRRQAQRFSRKKRSSSCVIS
jgi:predicted Fe-S protein YdhL (DUF1289 family)